MKRLLVSVAALLLFAAPALAQNNNVIGAAQLYVGGSWSARLDLDNSTNTTEVANIFFLNSFNTATVSVNGNPAVPFFTYYLPPHKVTSFKLTNNVAPVANTWLSVSSQNLAGIQITGRLTHYDADRYICEYPLSAATDHYLLNAVWTPVEQTAFSIAIPANTGPTQVFIRALDLNNNEVNRIWRTLDSMGQSAQFIGEFLSLPLGFVGTLEITCSNPVLISTALFRE